MNVVVCGGILYLGMSAQYYNFEQILMAVKVEIIYFVIKIFQSFFLFFDSR